MEIHQLRLFREVVDAGSISEAARRLNLSQPPVSYHIKMLEQELQVTLFQRGRRSIELTEAGRLLYERAGALLDMESTVSREITEAGSRRTLRIGVTPTTAPILSMASSAAMYSVLLSMLTATLPPSRIPRSLSFDAARPESPSSSP
jgi:DNA-binding transcriptional LysR family regulator